MAENVSRAVQQVSVRNADRVVVQYGRSLGELDGCVIEDVRAETLAAIQAAMPDHGGGVILSEDHMNVTATPPPPDGTGQHAAGVA